MLANNLLFAPVIVITCYVIAIFLHYPPTKLAVSVPSALWTGYFVASTLLLTITGQISFLDIYFVICSFLQEYRFDVSKLEPLVAKVYSTLSVVYHISFAHVVIVYIGCNSCLLIIIYWKRLFSELQPHVLSRSVVMMAATFSRQQGFGSRVQGCEDWPCIHWIMHWWKDRRFSCCRRTYGYISELMKPISNVMPVNVPTAMYHHSRIMDVLLTPISLTGPKSEGSNFPCTCYTKGVDGFVLPASTWHRWEDLRGNLWASRLWHSCFSLVCCLPWWPSWHLRSHEWSSGICSLALKVDTTRQANWSSGILFFGYENYC